MKITEFDDIETLKRKNLNLSESAWKIIDADMDNYMKIGKKQLSTFLNIVFHNFYQQANASIYIKTNTYKEKLETLIKDKESIEILTNTYTKELEELITSNKAKVNSKRKDKNGKLKEVKFKLNNDNFDIIINSKDVSHPYYDNKERLYLNATFEEYTKLNGFEREKIYFKPFIDTYLIAKDINRCRLNISLIPNNNSKGFTFSFAPYGLFSDDTNSYLYFVGTRISSTGETKSISFRANNISKISIDYTKRFTNKDFEGLDEKIKTQGIMYLGENREIFKISLTDKGIELFNKTLNMRPNPSTIEGNTYTFECTKFQFKTYFLKFGKEALVSEPLYMKEDFLNEYKQAFTKYE